jgi:hypothetical protein
MEDSTRKLLFVLLDEAGVNDRHTLASEVLGIPVSSYVQLDDHEAWMIIRHLKQMIDEDHYGRGPWRSAEGEGDPVCCGIRQPTGECAYCGTTIPQRAVQ